MQTASVIWFAAFVVCLAAEMALPACVLLFAGIGALAASAASALDLPFSAQTGVFAAVSIFSALLLRSRLKPLLSREKLSSVAGPVPADTLGRVTKDIVPGSEGQVEAAGSFWRAVSSETLPAGTEIRVTGACGNDMLLLKVTPVLRSARH